MNNTYSTKPYPYVYICTHKVTKEFYIGYREQNVSYERTSDQDLPIYKTSSATVKSNFNDYDWYIVAEFYNGNDAFTLEQQLIQEHWNNPLLLNEQFRLNNTARFKRKSYGPLPQEVKDKISKTLTGRKRDPAVVKKISETNKGRAPWNKGIKTGPMSEENKEKIKKATTGRTRSADHCRKLSEAKKGKEPHNKGKRGGTNTQKGIPKPHQTGDNNPAKRADVRAKIAESKRNYWARKKAGIAPAL